VNENVRGWLHDDAATTLWSGLEAEHVLLLLSVVVSVCEMRYADVVLLLNSILQQQRVQRNIVVAFNCDTAIGSTVMDCII
jgi:hypothetical protein